MQNLENISFGLAYVLYPYILGILVVIVVVAAGIIYFVFGMPLVKTLQIAGLLLCINALIPWISPNVYWTKPVQTPVFQLTKEGIACVEKKYTSHPKLALISWKNIQDDKIEAKRYKNSCFILLHVKLENEPIQEVKLNILLLEQYEGKTMDIWANKFLQKYR